ncbi:unnamed protein product (macronuclear) [Paramecium tetraurelia]|uniref:Glutathione S-transferase n=1 Tax=Paramecium tetraurelia TaxID=5888 RepID=A0BM30_PARTE|nr:uncharacterized protein GSPATT00030231001 [Paramecium tetraurelia]CAK59597.1 unnamed protein product [Paramecium tetraurelia]|eukprot:XP_001426995.1 hypothetical protein (macronuclear) [Paramecium tetraurelia strain d4-2]
MSLVLVASKTCPHCIRVVLTLNHLKIPYELKYIDIENRPDWFIKASPLERVPILFVGDAVLFESLVILDYINTLTPQSLLPKDNLQIALNRARAEFSQEIIEILWSVFSAKTLEAFDLQMKELRWLFSSLETWLQQTKFISDNVLTLADFAYAPIFTIIPALKQVMNFDIFDGFPRLRAYVDNLHAIPELKMSLVENYDQLIQKKIQSREPYFWKQ